jgi:DNA-directed RNA polymerase subunit K/omega
MVTRPVDFNAYEFVTVAALRAHQLMAGCIPLVGGEHKATTKALMEVATGKVVRTASGVAPGTVLVEV